MSVKSYNQQHIGHLPILMSHILHSQLLSKKKKGGGVDSCAFQSRQTAASDRRGLVFWTVVMSPDADLILALLDHVLVQDKMSFDSSRL